MLTPEQIAALGDAAASVAVPIEEYLIKDIARRIAEAGQFTSTAAYQIYRAQQLGLSRHQIKQMLLKELKVSHAELRRLLTQSAEVGYNFDIKRLSPFAVPFAQNGSIQQMVSAAVQLANKDFTNLVQSLGMIAPDGKPYPLQKAYQKACDFAFEQVFTGAADYNTAIRGACKNIADMGVRVIDYESGVHTGLEAAVRRNIMGGMGLMQEQISQYNHDTLGANGWEVSAHGGSAPDHEPIQGRQYSDKDYQQINGSLVRRIGTLNCGHTASPVIIGVNEPQYTEQQLQEMAQQNAKGVTYQGRQYTLYEASQKQRQIERAMRTQKNRILTAETSGDKDYLQISQIRLGRLGEEYKRFSLATGQRTQRERLEVTGFGKGQAARAAAAQKALQKVQNNGTVESSTVTDVKPDVHLIGKVDTSKLTAITDDIRTADVIITDDRIRHIEQRRGEGFYEKYGAYFGEVVTNPDYIFSDKENTALMVKHLQVDDKYLNLVLRIAVSTDDPTYKNSVITAIAENEKRFKQRLRNAEPLYKRE